MALIKCPECCKKVSDQSAYCIKCGYPLKKKTPCSVSKKLCVIEKNVRELQNWLTKETVMNDDENPITTFLFKMGIVFVLVFVFLAFLFASVKNAMDTFENNDLAGIINFIVHMAMASIVVLIYFLSQNQNLNSKHGKIVSKILKVSMIIIGLYIAVNAAFCIVADLNPDGEILVKYFSYQMLFGCSGLILIPMIQEVRKTKDKSYIMSYIALVLTIVFAIVQK